MDAWHEFVKKFMTSNKINWSVLQIYPHVKSQMSGIFLIPHKANVQNI